MTVMYFKYFGADSEESLPVVENMSSGGREELKIGVMENV